MKINISKRKPILEMFSHEALEMYEPETNIRTITTFSYPKPEEGSKEEFLINHARNSISKYQYSLPMKYLEPEQFRYVCQKAPLRSSSQVIDSAARVIEPLNVGFKDLIRTILINQDIPEGSIYTLHVENPYESETRYFFCSNQLVSESRKDHLYPEGKKNGYDFDPFIHIGSVDIGSEIIGKFVVKQVDLNIYKSYCLYKFELTDNSFSIITYDFMNISVKQILERIKECVKNELVPNGSLEEDIKLHSEIQKFTLKFLDDCLKLCK